MADRLFLRFFTGESLKLESEGSPVSSAIDGDGEMTSFRARRKCSSRPWSLARRYFSYSPAIARYWAKSEGLSLGIGVRLTGGMSLVVGRGITVLEEMLSTRAEMARGFSQPSSGSIRVGKGREGEEGEEGD